jgi:hypothetical protein
MSVEWLREEAGEFVSFAKPLGVFARFIGIVAERAFVLTGA